jgi:hypothetical protein
MRLILITILLVSFFGCSPYKKITCSEGNVVSVPKRNIFKKDIKKRNKLIDGISEKVSLSLEKSDLLQSKKDRILEEANSLMGSKDIVSNRLSNACTESIVNPCSSDSQKRLKEAINQLNADIKNLELLDYNVDKTLNSQGLGGSSVEELFVYASDYNNNLESYGSDEVPEFPFPLPEYSAIYKFPDSYYEGVDNFEELDRILSTALENKGYHFQYYSIPKQGFAIITQMERCNADGTSNNDARWDIEFKNVTGFVDYFNRLFTGKKGLCRTIVFLVSNGSFSYGERVEKDDATGLLSNGLLSLPGSFGDRDLKDHNISAIIYEFQIMESDENPVNHRSNLSGREHLIQSKILEEITKLKKQKT